MKSSELRTVELDVVVVAASGTVEAVCCECLGLLRFKIAVLNPSPLTCSKLSSYLLPLEINYHFL